jgi:hypothetical protein
MKRNYEVEEIIINFKEYLEETGTKENEITFEDVNDYITGLHFDIVDEYGSIDAVLVEEDIEKVIYENFNIIIND